jgi:peptidoglycan/LPS O-acetylase OafA/YrhL
LIAIAAFIGIEVVSYFMVWLLGTAAVLAPKPKLGRGRWTVSLVIATSLCVVGVMVPKITNLAPLAVDLVMGVAVAILIYVLSIVPDGASRTLSARSPVERAGRWSASFSYSLYLVHLPALVFVDAAWNWLGGGKWQPGLLSLLVGTGLAAAMLAYAWVVSRLTEAHTERVSLYLIRTARAGHPGIGERRSKPEPAG